MPSVATADSWVRLQPRISYEVSLRGVSASARVDRAGRYPISRWLKVAPGERAVAVWGRDTGLVVQAASGESIFRRPGAIGAFAFSADGMQLAFATPGGAWVVELDRPEPHLVAAIAGVDFVRFTDRGLVVRTGGKLALIEESGTVRILARTSRMTALAAAGSRAVYFADGIMVSIDLADIAHVERTRLADRADVLDAELSPKGRDLLWRAGGHIYLREGTDPARSVVAAEDVATLAFSPDGSAWLWSTYSGGGIVTAEGSRPLPDGFGRACFRAGGDGIVIVSRTHIALWSPAAGTQSVVGGVDPAETSLWSADMIGTELITLSARTPPGVKEHSAPAIDP